MVHGRKGEVVIEEFSKFFDKGRDELWTMIRDDFVIKSKVEVNFVEKEGGYPFGGDGFLGEAENYPLCKAMVNHNQQRIKARRNREIGGEVVQDLLEGA